VGGGGGGRGLADVVLCCAVPRGVQRIHGECDWGVRQSRYCWWV
jgi:hypothetical protein